MASAYAGRGTAKKYGSLALEAIEDWEKAIELNPEIYQVYLEIGSMYLHLGNKGEAAYYLKACKERSYDRLPAAEKARLDEMIRVATR